jgi:hypothetical protein
VLQLLAAPSHTELELNRFDLEVGDRPVSDMLSAHWPLAAADVAAGKGNIAAVSASLSASVSVPAPVAADSCVGWQKFGFDLYLLVRDVWDS